MADQLKKNVTAIATYCKLNLNKQQTKGYSDVTGRRFHAGKERQNEQSRVPNGENVTFRSDMP